MDLSEIEMTFGFLGPSGVVLSAERRVAVQTSLLLLQNDERFESVEYWGRIVGTNSDYYIAQGRPKGSPFKTKTFYRYVLCVVKVVMVCGGDVVVVTHIILTVGDCLFVVQSSACDGRSDSEC